MVSLFEARRRGWLITAEDEEVFAKEEVTAKEAWLMDERNRRRERYRNVIDLAPDSVDKTLSQLGIDFGTDPLTWLPGTVYGKAFEKVKFAGDYAAAANNARLGLKGLPVEKSAYAQATEKMNAARVGYSIDGSILEDVSFKRRGDDMELAFKFSDGRQSRVWLTSPEEKAMIERLGGDEVARYVNQSAKISAELGDEMKKILSERITVMKADPVLGKKLDELAGELNVTVDELADKVGQVMNKTLISFSDDAGQLIDKVYTGLNPQAYRLLEREFSGNSKLLGLESLYKGRNNRLKYAHAETFGFHQLANDFAKMGRLDDLKGATVRKVVYGRNVCDDCFVNIAIQARELGLANVLLFEQKTGRVLFWSSDMSKDTLVYMGRLDRSVENTVIKGLAVGGSQMSGSSHRDDENPSQAEKGK